MQGKDYSIPNIMRKKYTARCISYSKKIITSEVAIDMFALEAIAHVIVLRLPCDCFAFTIVSPLCLPCVLLVITLRLRLAFTLRLPCIFLVIIIQLPFDCLAFNFRPPSPPGGGPPCERSVAVDARRLT